MSKKEKLRDSEERFCIEYMKDSNATRSYMSAFKPKKRSTAGVEGNRLLKIPKIKERIATLGKQYTEIEDVKISDIIKEYKRIAFGHPKELYDSGGTLKNPHAMGDDAAAMLAGMKKSSTLFGSSESFTRTDKLKALEMLAKYKKLFGDDSGDATVVHVTISKK